MTKQLKPGEYPIDYPIPLSDLAIGRNWIRKSTLISMSITTIRRSCFGKII